MAKQIQKFYGTNYALFFSHCFNEKLIGGHEERTNKTGEIKIYSIILKKGELLIHANIMAAFDEMGPFYNVCSI